MNYLTLFLMFCHIGLFTIGGGLAALPLMHDAFVESGILTNSEFYDMVAISQSTPGPIGINMATFVGFRNISYAGAVIATIGMVTPSLITIYLIARFVDDFEKNPIVRRSMRGFRTSAVGLIASAVYYVLIQSVINVDEIKEYGVTIDDLLAVVVCVGIGVLYYRTKCHPALCIAIGAIAGVFLF